MPPTPPSLTTATIPQASEPTDTPAAPSGPGLFLSPELATWRILRAVESTSLMDTQEANALLAELRTQAQALQNADLRQVHATLLHQATSLQTLFVRLTEWGLEGQSLTHLEAFLRLALRAQNQSRQTLETLGRLHQPPAVVARQVNVSHGPQQINNTLGVALAAGAESPSQLLEDTNDGQRLDPCTTGAASAIDSALAALDPGDGPAHRRR